MSRERLWYSELQLFKSREHCWDFDLCQENHCWDCELQSFITRLTLLGLWITADYVKRDTFGTLVYVKRVTSGTLNYSRLWQEKHFWDSGLCQESHCWDSAVQLFMLRETLLGLWTTVVHVKRYIVWTLVHVKRVTVGVLNYSLSIPERYFGTVNYSPLCQERRSWDSGLCERETVSGLWTTAVNGKRILLGLWRTTVYSRKHYWDAWG
jgi:hypothetical protein